MDKPSYATVHLKRNKVKRKFGTGESRRRRGRERERMSGGGMDVLSARKRDERLRNAAHCTMV